MRLNQIEFIVEIAKCHSFSAAAKKLCISQPSLSAAVSSLEEELGVTIFNRTPRGTYLTEIGDAVIKNAESVLAAIDHLERSVDHYTSAKTVSIAASPVASNSMTIQLLKRMMANHPEIQLNLIEMRPYNIIETLPKGHSDLVIGLYARERENVFLDYVWRQKLHVEPLLIDRSCVFLSRNHPLAKKKSISIGELEGEAQAVYQDFLYLGEDDTTTFEKVDNTRQYIFSDRTSIKQMVAEDLAYAIFPYQMILEDIFIKSGLIRAVPIADSASEFVSYMAWRENDYLPAHYELVMNEIRVLYREIEEQIRNLDFDKWRASKDTGLPCNGIIRY